MLWPRSKFGIKMVGAHSHGRGAGGTGLATLQCQECRGKCDCNAWRFHQLLHLLPPVLVADMAVAEDVQECGASIPWGKQSWACELGLESYNYSVSSSDTKKATL